jgi:hypothetical protein
MAKAVWHMVHAGNQRAEVRPMGRAAGGQRQRAQRPAVKGAVKSDDVRTLGVIARELDGGFTVSVPELVKKTFLGAAPGARRLSFSASSTNGS